MIDGVVSSAPYTISNVQDSTHTISATFAADTHSITVTSSQTWSGFVKVEGADITTPQTFSWLAGEHHTIEAQSPVSGGTNIQYTYSSWSDNGAQSHTITVPSSDTTYTATYQQENTIQSTSLTISCTPETVSTTGGSVVVNGYLTITSSKVGISGQTITISCNTGNGLEQVASVTTDSNGHYTTDPWSVPGGLTEGEFYVVTANFEASGSYDASQALTTNGPGGGGLLVLPEYVFGALAALGACFMAFVVFKKRNNLPHFKRL